MNNGGPGAARPPVGNMNAADNKISMLSRRMGGRGGSAQGKLGTVTSYQVVKDPRVQSIQKSVINRWQQEFIRGAAEGRSGKDQGKQVGSGPRKTIKCMDNPLRFRGTGSLGFRKSKTQRMIEGGDLEGAMYRMRQFSIRKRPSAYQDPRKMSDTDADAMASQVGLLATAKTNFKKIKDKKRLDAVSM